MILYILDSDLDILASKRSPRSLICKTVGQVETFSKWGFIFKVVFMIVAWNIGFRNFYEIRCRLFFSGFLYTQRNKLQRK